MQLFCVFENVLPHTQTIHSHRIHLKVSQSKRDTSVNSDGTLCERRLIILKSITWWAGWIKNKYSYRGSSNQREWNWLLLIVSSAKLRRYWRTLQPIKTSPPGIRAPPPAAQRFVCAEGHCPITWFKRLLINITSLFGVKVGGGGATDNANPPQKKVQKGDETNVGLSTLNKRRRRFEPMCSVLFMSNSLFSLLWYGYLLGVGGKIDTA